MKHVLIGSLIVFNLSGCTQLEGLGTAIFHSASQSEILPGSKGDRQLNKLEVQLRLPDLGSEYVIQTVDAAGLKSWAAQIDGQEIGQIRLVSESPQPDQEVLLTFELLQVPLSAEKGYQEISLYNSEGVLQSAAVIPALKSEQQKLLEPLSDESTAIWFMATVYKQINSKSFKDLSSAEFQKLSQSSEIKSLARYLKDLYQKGKGKLDPREDSEFEKQLKSSAQEFLGIEAEPESTEARDSQQDAQPEKPVRPEAVKTAEPKRQSQESRSREDLDPEDAPRADKNQNQRSEQDQDQERNRKDPKSKNWNWNWDWFKGFNKPKK